MFCALCRKLFWRNPKPGGRLQSRSRTRAVRRAAVKARSSVRANEEQWDQRSGLAITEVPHRNAFESLIRSFEDQISIERFRILRSSASLQ